MRIPKAEAHEICVRVMEGWARSLAARKYLAVDGFGVWSVTYRRPKVMGKVCGVMPNLKPAVDFAPSADMIEAFLEGFRTMGSLRAPKVPMSRRERADTPLEVIRLHRYGGC